MRFSRYKPSAIQPPEYGTFWTQQTAQGVDGAGIFMALLLLGFDYLWFCIAIMGVVDVFCQATGHLYIDLVGHCFPHRDAYDCLVRTGFVYGLSHIQSFGMCSNGISGDCLLRQSGFYSEGRGQWVFDLRQVAVGD